MVATVGWTPEGLFWAFGPLNGIFAHLCGERGLPTELNGHAPAYSLEASASCLLWANVTVPLLECYGLRSVTTKKR